MKVENRKLKKLLWTTCVTECAFGKNPVLTKILDSSDYADFGV